MSVVQRVIGYVIVFVVGISSLGAQGYLSNRSKIADLKKGLFSDSRIDPDRLDEIRKQMDEIHDLVRAEILMNLNAGVESAQELNNQLRPALEANSKTPVSIIEKKLNGIDVLLVAYSIMYGASALPTTSTVIEGFRKVAGRYEAVTRAGEILDGSRALLEELPSPWSTELWFLAHGQESGVMQYHEKMAIYSFDGSAFKKLWAPAPRKAPNVQITKDSVIVTYEQEPESGPLLVQTMLLTPAGVVEGTPIPKN